MGTTILPAEGEKCLGDRRTGRNALAPPTSQSLPPNSSHWEQPADRSCRNIPIGSVPPVLGSTFCNTLLQENRMKKSKPVHTDNFHTHDEEHWGGSLGAEEKTDTQGLVKEGMSLGRVQLGSSKT